MEAKEEQKSVWEEKLNTFANTEDKIAFIIEVMKTSLAQSGSPDFKSFWDAKKICLDLFKENLNPIMRNKFWASYIELSDEARKLKEMRNEESAFASEQIELALKAVEDEIKDYDQFLAKQEEVPFPPNCRTIAKKRERYNELQKELNLLNVFANRISSLRKEILKQGSFLKNKGKFFKQLSLLGDAIFPKRKELIKAVSLEFIQDVEDFSSRFLDVKKPPTFVLKQEIKDLQNIAKILTLNSAAFNTTRVKLSECWDKLKGEEKEKKQELIEKKKSSLTNYEVINAKIDEFTKEKEGKSRKEIESKAKELLLEMDAMQLMSEDAAKLEESIERLRKDPDDLSFEEIKKTILANLEKEVSDAEIEKIEQIIGKFPDFEKDLLEHLLFKLKDKYWNKKKCSAKSNEDFEEILDYENGALEKNRLILEKYRKALGQSGFDFEKAIAYRDMMDEERERSRKLSDSIEELLAKVDD